MPPVWNVFTSLSLAWFVLLLCRLLNPSPTVAFLKLLNVKRLLNFEYLPFSENIKCTCHVYRVKTRRHNVLLVGAADFCNGWQPVPLINYSVSVSSSISHFENTRREGRWVEREIVHLCFGVWKQFFQRFRTKAWQPIRANDQVALLISDRLADGWSPCPLFV